VVEPVIGIAQGIEGGIEAPVEAAEVREQRFQQRHSPAWVVLIQPAVGHLCQQMGRHGPAGQGGTQPGTWDLLKQ